MRSAVILAGGYSRRLGQEKSLLQFDEKPLICWTLKKLSSVTDEIVVVARDEAHARRLVEAVERFMPDAAMFAWDELPGFGPVAGLYAGMKKAKGELCFAAACDLPFLCPRVVDRLFQIAVQAEEDGLDGAVPVHPNGLFEPLHCVYGREKMQQACESAIKIGERRVHATLRELAIRSVPVDLLRPLDRELLTFFNLNASEDLERARVLWLDHRSKLGW
jgi:molybdopterin-guanine dinucleotide biosynthesis protein A